MLIKPKRYFAKDGGGNGGATTPPSPDPKNQDTKADDTPSGDTPPEIPEWFQAIQNDPNEVWKRIQDIREESKSWRVKYSDASAKLDELQTERKQTTQTKATSPEPPPEPTVDTSILERLKAENEQLKTQQKLDALKLKVGSELGLSVTLSQRLNGTTEDELRQDGEALLKDVKPADNDGSTGRRRTTQTPGQTPARETDEERRARLFGGARGTRVFTNRG